MINDNSPYQSSTENGNPIHQSSSDNLTHQQPLGDNFAQFIRMIGNLSPADRQALASALSPSPPSPETDLDPYLSTKPVVKTLEPYDRLEEWLPSFKQRNEFFNLTKTRELEDYADVKKFHRVQHLDYAAPPLTNSRDVNVHKSVYKRDQDLATIQTRLAHLTRPIDATVHAILAAHPMDFEDPILINIVKTFDILRYNLAFIATEITHLRKEGLYRDKKIIPPADPNDKAPLITHQQFIDQEKLTHSLRKASGQTGRGRGRGRGRGGFNHMGNRNGQQNNKNYIDNSLENSGNNNVSITSQVSESDTSTSSNNNNNPDNNGNHFQQSSTTRGRDRGRWIIGYEDDKGSLSSIIRADELCLCPPNPPCSLDLFLRARSEK
ncbi:hypothetical protein K457DRAFT_132555 [Linnemannia elongata AG-77]|uniref:Uncharacterized protein n=1 Tax=Linnemannia elongata AG-77 TaxID=1314771 RepID=A0A197KEH7_9FUNG|nr:hypothetical protein K457DRAFT_132555 [Linnemannia elongata AG-77]